MNQQTPCEEKGGKASNSKRPDPAIETLEETLNAAAEIVRAHIEAATQGASLSEAKLMALQSKLLCPTEGIETQSHVAPTQFDLFPITYKLYEHWNENIISTLQQLQRTTRAQNIEEALNQHSNFNAQNLERFYRQYLELISVTQKNFLGSMLRTVLLGL